jgi:hypothetical protein
LYQERGRGEKLYININIDIRKTAKACHSNFFKMEYGKLGKMETSLEQLN